MHNYIQDVDLFLPFLHSLLMSERLLEGHSTIITGASSGLGYTIAESFVRAGANIMMCARGEQRLMHACEKLLKIAHKEQIVTAETADISSHKDVTRLLSESDKIFPSINILVNNAAVVGPIGLLESVDWEAWSETIEINLHGAVNLCRQVLPQMKRRKAGKILMISAGGATSPDPRFSAYASSKAALVGFAATLAEEVRIDGIDVNCIAPGGLATTMNDEKLMAGPLNLTPEIYEQLLKRKKEGGQDPNVAAELAVLLASHKTNGITGKLISAVWDDWRKLPSRKDELGNTDIYTLRRIVPTDRGFEWG